MDASPAGQAASRRPRKWARLPVGPLAGQPTVHPSNQAILEPAASSPAGWSASQAGSQPATSRRADRQPSRATTASSHGAIFDDSITQNARFRENPGRNKNWVNSQTPEGTKIGGAASSPSQLALGQPGRQLTASLVTIKASGQPTGWPPAAIRPAS